MYVCSSDSLFRLHTFHNEKKRDDEQLRKNLALEEKTDIHELHINTDCVPGEQIGSMVAIAKPDMGFQY